jgi:acyl-CoA synthetase (NDP forming)
LKKPVIVLKAGATEAGIRAAASHTSAMAGSNTIWQNMLNQVGAIQVSSVGELVDVASIFLQVPSIKGRRTLVVGLGGGASVIAADDCTRAGLVIPTLPSESRLKLNNLCGSEIGGSFRNPIDLYRADLLQQVIEIAYNRDHFDILLAHIPFELYGLTTDDLKNAVVKMFCQSLINLKGTEFSPHIVVLHGYSTARARQRAMEAHAMLCEAGFAVFETVERAAEAINKVIQYNQRL